MQGLSQLGQAQGGTMQLPGLHTINLNTLQNSGLQMHQLQGVPITISNTAGTCSAEDWIHTYPIEFVFYYSS